MAGLGRKTFTAGDVLTASDVQSYLQDQSVMVFAGTAARSSAIATPTEGMFALTKDNDELDYYDGSAWVSALPIGAWTTWTPILSGGWLNGNGVWDAKYVQIGKTVHLSAKFVLGTTTTKGTTLTMSLPVAALSNRNPLWLGRASVAGGSLYNVFWEYTTSTTTTLTLGYVSAAPGYIGRANITSTIPLTWATGDYISITATYDAA